MIHPKQGHGDMILTCKERLISELRKDDKRFHRYFQTSTAQFDHLEALLKPVLRKAYTNLRTPITVGECLAVTLRYLATGDSFTTIAFNYRMGLSTVSTIVGETCAALWDVLVDTHMPTPTEETWIQCEKRFRQVWNFPNCIGAIDGSMFVYRHQQIVDHFSSVTRELSLSFFLH